MAESKLVSVIVINYNRQKSLHQALDSVFSQTYQNLEVILVDDGSAPALQRQLWARYHAHKRCQLLLQAQHLGFPGAVRNLGIRISRGAYIAFLDSDDLWLEDKLQLQMSQTGVLRHCREYWWRYLNSLEQDENQEEFNFNRESDLLKSGAVREISQAGQQHPRAGGLFNSSLQKCIIGPSTVLIERQFLENCGLFREDLQVAEDYELWLRLTAKTEVSYLDLPLVIKRDHPADCDQLSQRYTFIEKFRIQALEHLLANGQLPPERRAAAKNKLAEKYQIWANGAARRGRTDEANTFSSKARRLGKG